MPQPVTTPSNPAAWSPDVTAFLAGDLVPQSLILQAATVASEVDGDRPSMRVPFVADDGVAAFVPEGSDIPTADQEFSEVVVQTRKLAALGSYSSETLAQPNAATLIAESLSRSLVHSADAVFCGNSDAAPIGIFADPSVIDGGTVSSLDQLVDAVATIETDGGTATHILASPASWATLAKIKSAADSNLSILGAGTEDAQRRVLSLPVLTSSAVAAQSLAVLDKGAVVAAVGQVRLDRSEHVAFDQDAIRIRAAWRLGWSIMRPARVIKLSTDAGGEPAE